MQASICLENCHFTVHIKNISVFNYENEDKSRQEKTYFISLKSRNAVYL